MLVIMFAKLFAKINSSWRYEERITRRTRQLIKMIVVWLSIRQRGKELMYDRDNVLEKLTPFVETNSRAGFGRLLVARLQTVGYKELANDDTHYSIVHRHVTAVANVTTKCDRVSLPVQFIRLFTEKGE